MSNVQKPNIDKERVEKWSESKELPKLPPLQYGEALGAKQENVAYIWLMFFGVIGAHYFYLGRPGKAISYIFTLGYVGIGPLTDIFRMRGIVDRVNGKRVGA